MNNNQKYLSKFSYSYIFLFIFMQNKDFTKKILRLKICKLKAQKKISLKSNYIIFSTILYKMQNNINIYNKYIIKK